MTSVAEKWSQWLKCIRLMGASLKKVSVRVADVTSAHSKDHT